MKKYKLKSGVKVKLESALILSLFYLFLIGSVLLVNARFEQLNEQTKSTQAYETISANK